MLELGYPKEAGELLARLERELHGQALFGQLQSEIARALEAQRQALSGNQEKP